MSDNDLYQNSLSRLERLLANPNGFPSEDLMNKLSWVDKRLQDKRKRPPAARRAVELLKDNNLWDTYLAEYAPKKNHKARYEQAGKRPNRRNVLLRLNDAEQGRLDDLKQPGEPDATAIKRLAGLSGESK